MAYNSSLGVILLVDDDKDICELLQVNLKNEGYHIETEINAAEVCRRDLTDIDLIIADGMRQQYTGMDLVYDLKENPETENIAFILYSTFAGESMTIDALEAGADDYIVKPFSLRELVARVKSVMRRHVRSAAPRSLVTFKNLTADIARQNVKIDGVPVPLTPKEFAILAMLLRNIDSYVGRLEIFKTVWNDETAGSNERIVDTNISRLRKKLGDLAPYLISRTGHGYMLSTTINQ